MHCIVCPCGISIIFCWRGDSCSPPLGPILLVSFYPNQQCFFHCCVSCIQPSSTQPLKNISPLSRFHFYFHDLWPSICPHVSSYILPETPQIHIRDHVVSVHVWKHVIAVHVRKQVVAVHVWEHAISCTCMSTCYSCPHLRTWCYLSMYMNTL